MRKSPIKIKDIIGLKFNFLTIISEEIPKYHKGNKITMLLCKCDCGNNKIISWGNISSNNIKSCGCKKKQLVNNAIQKYYRNKYKTPVEDRLYSNYNKSWNKEKRKFTLSKEKFIELVNSKCFYCGKEPFLIRGNKTKSVIKALNGIDRIDSNIGYIEENVVSCCIHCNRAKMDRNIEDFKLWVKDIFYNLYPYEKGRI